MVGLPFLLDSLSAAVGFVFFVGASVIQSLRDDSKAGRSETRWAKNKNAKRNTDPRTRMNVFHLLGTLSTFVLSLTHAILLAKSRDDRLELKADHDVAAVLFGSLIWLVIFLSMTDASAGAGYAQYVPWMLSLVSYTISTAFVTAKKPSSPADLAIQWIRIGGVLTLILSVATPWQGRKSQQDTEEPTTEETQPLINAEETEPQKAADDEEDDDDEDDDKSVKSSLSEDDDKPEEEMTDAQKEEKNQRQALRNRPWYSYLASFSIFIPFVRPRKPIQWFYLSIMIFNTLVARVITLGQPLMLGAVVDDLAKQQFTLWKILAYVGLRFASSSSGTSLIKNIVSYRLNIELHNTLLTHCYNHIMDLDATFHMSKSTPSTWQIMDRGQSVINLLQDVVFDYAPVVADLIIALFVVSHLFGAYLCFAVATTMILLSWSNKITMAKKTRMRRYFVDVWRNWYTHMSESFMHWRTVSEFNKVRYEKGRHLSKTNAVTKVNIQQRSFSIYLAAVQEIVVTLGFLFVCIIAALEISSGRLDVGRFVVLITYWSQIMSPVTRIAGFASDIAEQLVDAEKLMLLLEKKPRVTNTPNAPNFVFKGGKIEFETCSFSYDGSRTVTKDVSFSAEPGQTVALVGETGGGKSTIFNLLYRFYDPTEGRVLVDGQDISKVNLESFRAVLGLVPQDPVLFNSSILKNVRYSNIGATKAEVVEACRAAQFHEKVEKFPKKYLQKVGELAQKLSGGEKQRLAIARAILKTPGILLLDEATSAVDSVTEAKIQESLDFLSEGRTTFVIAHRLSTILNADKILVIKNGEIVESGSHQVLLEHGNGAYKELWEAQLKLSQGKEKKTKDDKKDGDLMSFDQASEAGDNKVAGEKYDQSTKQADSDSDQKDTPKEEELQAAHTGILTPPASRDPTPRTGSVVNDDPNATTDRDGKREEDDNETKGTTDVDETLSSTSDRSQTSRNYGTL